MPLSKENPVNVGLDREADLTTEATAELKIWQGVKLEKEGEVERAIACYRQAVQIDSQSAQAHKILAIALRKQGKLTAANLHYRQAIEIEQQAQEDFKILKRTNGNSNLRSILWKNQDKQVNDRQHSAITLPTMKTISPEGYTTPTELEVARIYLQQALAYCDEKQWQKGIAACQEALKICPDLAEAYKVWGNILQKIGKIAEAIGYYAKAASLQPEMAEIYGNLGSLYAKQHKWQQALDYYQKAVELDPNCAGFYRNLAKIWEELGKDERALACFLQALALDPQMITADRHFQLAEELWAEGKEDWAILCYKNTIKLAPNFKDGYLKLAKALEAQNQWQEAGDCYQKIIQLQNHPAISGTNPDTRKRIRRLLAGDRSTQKALNPARTKPNSAQKLIAAASKQKAPDRALLSPSQAAISPESKVDLAIQKYLQQAQLEPNLPGIQVNLGSLYARQKQWEQAILHYQKAISLAPNLAVAYRNLGRAYQKIGETTKAAAICYKAYTLEPKSVSGAEHLQLGKILAAQNQLQAAVACYRRAIQLDSSLTEAYLSLGALALQQEDLKGALVCYQQAIKQDNQNASAYFGLGKVLARQQNWLKAVLAYRRAIDLAPNLGDAWHDLGDALSKQEQYTEAIVAYRRAIELQPNFSWSYHNLGDVLLKLERWSEATTCFRQAIALKDDFVWSYQNLAEALSKQELWTEAIATYRQAINLQFDLPWAHYNLGEALGKMLLWSEAVEAYQSAISLKPDFVEAHAHLADALVRLDRWSEAIALYETAVDLDPTIDISVYRNLGEALARRKYLTTELTETNSNRSARWPYASINTYEAPPSLPDGSPWPKISIVTPSYNQGEFIEETILSVIHQDYPNLEYILIDGGSTDKTMEIVDRYRESFSYVVSEADNGQSAALNKGFSRATGEIFTWLNSDDRLAPNALYAVALAFYSSKADVVAGICQVFRNDLEIERHLTSCPNGEIALADILDVENCWLKGKFFYQPEVMFSRAIWEKAGGSIDESLYYSMDYELWARFAANQARIQVIGYPVAQYRMHTQQKTSTIEKYEPELIATRDLLQRRFNKPAIERPKIETIRHLRIVLFNDTGYLGGAGIAHQRIASALSAAGHQVIPVAGTLDWSLTPVECQATEVYELIARLEPDLVVVGNIHNFRSPLEILEKIAANFPTMFVMHDQWLLTGRCGYVGNCNKYQTLCDATCPTADEYPCLATEKIAGAYQSKRDLLTDANNLLIVGDSHWTSNWARETFLSNLSLEKFPDFQHQFPTIYYGLDLAVFYPQAKIDCRRQLGLPETKFIILTGSQSLEDERKGFGYLLKAMEIADLDDIILISFGHGKDLSTKIDVRSTGYIDNPWLLACYYSAADLFVGASLEEAFGQTFIEAAACGTPAIGYATGGVTEAIGDRVSGRIVAEKTPEALAETIVELYRDRTQLRLLSQTAPLYVANHFSLAASYHSWLEALEKSNWLAKLKLTPVTKLTAEIPESLPMLSLKGGKTQDRSEIISGKAIQGYILEGFDVLEPPYPSIGLSRPHRWLLSSPGKLAIASKDNREGQLTIACRNISPGQFIELYSEETMLFRAAIEHSTIERSQVFSIPVSLQQGLNFFELKADRYSEDQSGRKLGILVENLAFIDRLDWQALLDGENYPASSKIDLPMDSSLYGAGWLPLENFNGIPVRWMQKTASIIVDGITRLKALKLTILGISAVKPEFIDRLTVNIAGKSIQGNIERQTDGWSFVATIPTDVFVSIPFVLSLDTSGMAPLGIQDPRIASLLIKKVTLETID
jgi:tetratricopeptide (TPR) repeat protein/glycosyltransferase involved in cell wall biosynthesis